MSDLRERVARAISDCEYPKLKPCKTHYEMADAAIALIRAEVLEEAERAVRKALEEHGDPLALEAAIRALKEKSDE